MKKFLIALSTAFLIFCSAAYAEDGVFATTVSIGGSTANMVYVDMSASARTGKAVISSQLAPASAKSLIDSVSDGKVISSMNGGFFNAYYNTNDVKFPDNYPRVYGTVISGGKILNGGSTANVPALMFDYSGNPHIGYGTVSTRFVINGTEKLIYNGINNLNSNCFTEDMKIPFYVESGETVTYVNNGVVQNSVVCSGANLKTEPGMMIILGEHGLKSGDTVELKYSASLDGSEINAKTILTCGPMLLSKGENVSANNSENYDSKQNADTVAQRSFAAVASDGRLILGEVNSSPNKIAAYLQSIDVKDAMLFDGGASSMLYSSDKGFIQSAGRNLASVFMVVDEYQTDNSIIAEPSSSKVRVNGENIAVKAYNIEGNNYFKLRDISYMLKDTAYCFSVGWDSSSQTITITNGQASDYQVPSTDILPEKAAESTANVIINGAAANFTAYNIGGNNYFKLRDIADKAGFNISWDSESSTVIID